MKIILFYDNLNTENFFKLQTILNEQKFQFDYIALEELQNKGVNFEIQGTHFIFAIDKVQFTTKEVFFYLGFASALKIPVVFINCNDISTLTTIKQNITCVNLDDFSSFIVNENKQYNEITKKQNAKKTLLLKGYSLFDEVFVQAVESNNLEAVNLFLAAGFSVATCDKTGTPILSLAVRLSLNEMIKTLLEANAPVNLVSKDRKYSALMDAVQIGDYVNAKLLLEHGANPDFQSEDGQTALILAVGRQEKELVKVLLAHKANPDIADKLGMSATKYAKIFNNPEISKLFS